MREYVLQHSSACSRPQEPGWHCVLLLKCDFLVILRRLFHSLPHEIANSKLANETKRFFRAQCAGEGYVCAVVFMMSTPSLPAMLDCLYATSINAERKKKKKCTKRIALSDGLCAMTAYSPATMVTEFMRAQPCAKNDFICNLNSVPTCTERTTHSACR